MPENNADHNNITLKFHCHCNLASYTLSVPSSSLPLGSAICHCSSCRHVTGQLAGSFVAVPPQVELDVSNLTRYASSEWYTRYFCPRCGADVANYAGGRWRLCTGLLEKDVFAKGWLQRKQIFVEGTGDGGMSVWLPDLEKMAGGAEGMPPEKGTYFAPERIDWSSEGTRGGGKVFASCHCRGVQFMLTGPKHDDLSPGLYADGGKWWLRDSGLHYAAVFDACESCRLTTGFELVAWAHVPRANICMVDGSPFQLEAGTLAHYESSPGIQRDFCMRCGATVFFRKDGRKPEIWDVAVGLLQVESGARAEEWFGWDAEVSLGEEAVDRGLVRMLKEGLKSWRGAGRGHSES
jgi:hypothetical protein